MAQKKQTKHKGDKKRHRESKQTSKSRGRKRGPKFKAPPRRGSKEFNKLQKYWYDLIAQESKPGADDGFIDLEWTDHTTGKGQNSDYLRGSDSLRLNVYNTSTLDYYRLCSNYYTHAWRTLAPRDRLIWKLWSEGVTLREIVKAYNKRFKCKRSLYWIFRAFERIEANMYKWNKENPEGLLNEANVDFYITDIPLKDMNWFKSIF